MHGFHVVQNLKLVSTDIEERGAAEFLDPLSLMMRISRSLILNPISTGLFCLVVALGGGVFSFHNSFVFKVRLLKFCTEILSDRMNNLR